MRPFESVSKNLVLICVLVLSTWVAVDGAVFGQSGLQQIALANNSALEWVVWYVPQFSPLWYPFIQHTPLGPLDWLMVIYCAGTAGCLGVDVLRNIAEHCRPSGLGTEHPV